MFTYGYGLSYRRPAPVPRLSEDPGLVTAPPNVDRYFVGGRAAAPWTLALQGAVSARPVDAGAQEAGRLAEWSGPGAIAITGGPVDLSRQTTGDMALLFRYRVDLAPAAPVKLGVACGDDCSGKLDVTSLISSAPGGGWRTVKVKLSCFRSAGAKMDRVTAPFELSTNGRFSLAFSELRLVSNEGDAICPVQP